MLVYRFPETRGAEVPATKPERPLGLALKSGVDFGAELKKAGLEFITQRRDGNTYYDYHNLNGNGRVCLVGERVHPTNLKNPRCSAFVETPEHTIYHTCFSDNCEKTNQTIRALRALKIEHVLAPIEFKFTDLGNAERLYAEHGDNLRYAHDRCSWFYYDGTRWALDQTGEVHRRAAKTIRDMQAAAIHETNDEYRQKLLKWGIKCESNAMLNNMVSRAEKLEGFKALSSNFDKDPFSFNVQNGTIDLRTGELHPHDRGDFISKLAPVVYDPNADCPRWRQFLGEILPAPIVSFLRAAVGYTLSGDTRQKYLFMLIGEAGDNGKTTFIEALRKLFGDYAVNMNFNSLLPRDDNGPSGDIARLVGARFVSAAESNEGQRLSMAMLKRLVGGGDTLTARRLYENEIEFEPMHKIWLATNYQPVVPARDNAAWNRVLKIPFEISIPKDKQDKKLPDVFMRELPGILNWALDGWRCYQRDGLVIPPEISSATAEYRDSQDIVKQWMDECTSKSEDDRSLGANLYKNFEAYCRRTSGRGKATNVMANKTFYKELRRLGFEAKKEADGLVVMGLALKGQTDMYQDEERYPSEF